MVTILPVASGKGGVGKSALALNLAVTLAKMGKTVVLCDFDFGGANLHTLLGLKNDHVGIGNFIYRQADSLESLLQETPVKQLFFISGDCLLPGTGNMDFFIKKKIIKELQSVVADYVIIDLGGGTTYNTLDFFLLTYNSLLVTTPEITSIMNAYSFLKSAVYRFMYRQFPPSSGERAFIQEQFHQKMEGTDANVQLIIERLESAYTGAGKNVANEIALFRPQIIMNMGIGSGDLDMARRLQSLIKNKLGVTVDFIGYVMKDDSVPIAVMQRKPAVLLYPGSAFAQKLKTMATKIIECRYGRNDAFGAEADATDVLPQLFNE